MKNLKNSLIALVLVAFSFVSYTQIQTDSINFVFELSDSSVGVLSTDTLVSEYGGSTMNTNLSHDTLVLTDLDNNMSLKLTNHKIKQIWFLHTYDTTYNMEINMDNYYTSSIDDNHQLYAYQYTDTNNNILPLDSILLNTSINYIVIISHTLSDVNSNLISIGFAIDRVTTTDTTGGNVSVSDEILEVTNTRVYPNPVIDNLTVEFETTNSSTELGVYSTNGQLMFRDTDYRSFGKNIVSVDMSNYPKGMYIVRLGNEVKKVIKQ